MKKTDNVSACLGIGHVEDAGSWNSFRSRADPVNLVNGPLGGSAEASIDLGINLNGANRSLSTAARADFRTESLPSRKQGSPASEPVTSTAHHQSTGVLDHKRAFCRLSGRYGLWRSSRAGRRSFGA